MRLATNLVRSQFLQLLCTSDYLALIDEAPPPRTDRLQLVDVVEGTIAIIKTPRSKSFSGVGTTDVMGFQGFKKCGVIRPSRRRGELHETKLFKGVAGCELVMQQFSASKISLADTKPQVLGLIVSVMGVRRPDYSLWRGDEPNDPATHYWDRDGVWTCLVVHVTNSRFSGGRNDPKAQQGSTNYYPFRPPSYGGLQPNVQQNQLGDSKLSEMQQDPSAFEVLCEQLRSNQLVSSEQNPILPGLKLHTNVPRALGQKTSNSQQVVSGWSSNQQHTPTVPLEGIGLSSPAVGFENSCAITSLTDNNSWLEGGGETEETLGDSLPPLISMSPMPPASDATMQYIHETVQQQQRQIEKQQAQIAHLHAQQHQLLHSPGVGQLLLSPDALGSNNVLTNSATAGGGGGGGGAGGGATPSGAPSSFTKSPYPQSRPRQQTGSTPAATYVNTPSPTGRTPGVINLAGALSNPGKLGLASPSPATVAPQQQPHTQPPQPQSGGAIPNNQPQQSQQQQQQGPVGANTGPPAAVRSSNRVPNLKLDMGTPNLLQAAQTAAYLQQYVVPPRGPNPTIAARRGARPNMAAHVRPTIGPEPPAKRLKTTSSLPSFNSQTLNILPNSINQQATSTTGNVGMATNTTIEADLSLITADLQRRYGSQLEISSTTARLPGPSFDGCRNDASKVLKYCQDNRLLEAQELFYSTLQRMSGGTSRIDFIDSAILMGSAQWEWFGNFHLGHSLFQAATSLIPPHSQCVQTAASTWGAETVPPKTLTCYAISLYVMCMASYCGCDNSASKDTFCTYFQRLSECGMCVQQGPQKQNHPIIALCTATALVASVVYGERVPSWLLEQVLPVANGFAASDLGLPLSMVSLVANCKYIFYAGLALHGAHFRNNNVWEYCSVLLQEYLKQMLNTLDSKSAVLAPATQIVLSLYFTALCDVSAHTNDIKLSLSKTDIYNLMQRVDTFVRCSDEIAKSLCSAIENVRALTDKWKAEGLIIINPNPLQKLTTGLETNPNRGKGTAAPVHNITIAPISTRRCTPSSSTSNPPVSGGLMKSNSSHGAGLLSALVRSLPRPPPLDTLPGGGFTSNFDVSANVGGLVDTLLSNHNGVHQHQAQHLTTSAALLLQIDAAHKATVGTTTVNKPSTTIIDSTDSAMKSGSSSNEPQFTQPAPPTAKRNPGRATGPGLKLRIPQAAKRKHQHYQPNELQAAASLTEMLAQQPPT